MFLAIDIGNSNVTCGVFDGDRLAAHGKIPTDAAQPPAHYADALAGLLGASSVGPADLRGGAAASVVRGMVQKLREAVRLAGGPDLTEARADGDLGIRFAVPHPERVGIDRLLAAAAAFAAGGGPVVVADLGTALTVDLVSGDGVFLGGAIAPGLRLCLEALHLKTSLLPRVDLSPPASVLGTTTPDSIRSGVVYGAAGMVEGLVRRVSACAGGPARTVLTGGDAAFLSSHLSFPHELDPHLVLRGMLLAHRRTLKTG